MPQLIATQKDGNLHFMHLNVWESRTVGSETLIREAVSRHNITEDFSFTLCCDDHQNNAYDYSYSVNSGDYARAFPSMIYWGWPEVGINNYTSIVDSIKNMGAPRIMNKVGWIGNHTTHHTRTKLFDRALHPFMDAISNVWDRTDPKNLHEHTMTYLSLSDQVARWEYLIDVEGMGWSARLPLLMFSPRIVFIQDRPDREWWWPHLIPWETHVPVKRDLSDLNDSYHRLFTEPGRIDKIRQGQRKFAESYLTYDAQIDRIAFLIKDRLWKTQ